MLHFKKFILTEGMRTREYVSSKEQQTFGHKSKYIKINYNLEHMLKCFFLTHRERDVRES